MPIPAAPPFRNLDAAGRRVLVTSEHASDMWRRTQYLANARRRSWQWAEAEGWAALDTDPSTQGRAAYTATLARWVFPDGIRSGKTRVFLWVLRNEVAALGTWQVIIDWTMADGTTRTDNLGTMTTTTETWTDYQCSIAVDEQEQVRAARCFVKQIDGGADRRLPIESMTLSTAADSPFTPTAWVGLWDRSQSGPPDDVHSLGVWAAAQDALDGVPRALAVHARPHVSGGVNYAPATNATVVLRYIIPPNTIGKALRVRVKARDLNSVGFDVDVYCVETFAYAYSGTPDATVSAPTPSTLEWVDLPTFVPTSTERYVTIVIKPDSGGQIDLEAALLEWEEPADLTFLESPFADVASSRHAQQHVLPVLASRMRAGTPIVGCDAQGTGAPHAEASGRWLSRFAMMNNALVTWRLAGGTIVCDWLREPGYAPSAPTSRALQFRWRTGPFARSADVRVWAHGAMGASGRAIEFDPTWAADTVTVDAPDRFATVGPVLIPLPIAARYAVEDEGLLLLPFGKSAGDAITPTSLSVGGVRVDEEPGLRAPDEVYAWGYDGTGATDGNPATITITRDFPVGYLRVWAVVSGSKSTSTLTLSDGTVSVVIVAAPDLDGFTSGWISDLADDLAPSNPLSAFRDVDSAATWTLTPVNCDVTSWGLEVF
jgi:hypothetical protein